MKTHCTFQLYYKTHPQIQMNEKCAENTLRLPQFSVSVGSRAFRVRFRLDVAGAGFSVAGAVLAKPNGSEIENGTPNGTEKKIRKTKRKQRDPLEGGGVWGGARGSGEIGLGAYFFINDGSGGLTTLTGCTATKSPFSRVGTAVCISVRGPSETFLGMCSVSQLSSTECLCLHRHTEPRDTPPSLGSVVSASRWLPAPLTRPREP